MTANTPQSLVGVPVQTVLGQGDPLGAEAVNIRAMVCGGIDPSDLARRLSDPGASMEQRSEMLRDLRRRPDALRMYAGFPGPAQGPERIVQVAPDVLQGYLTTPARMAWLGEWLGSNNVALDCTPVAGDLGRMILRRLRSSCHERWRKGWTVWIGWLSMAAQKSEAEPGGPPDAGAGQ